MNSENSIDNVAKAIIESRYMLVLFFTVSLAISLIFYFTTPKTYTAEATILPIASGATGGIADFLAGTGIGMLANSETKANVIIIALESQSLAENVIKTYDISDIILNKPKNEINSSLTSLAATKLRQSIIRTSITKNGSIKIIAIMSDPSVAANLVNTYVSQLAVFFNEKRISMNFNSIDTAAVPLTPSGPVLMVYLVKPILIALFLSILYLSLNKQLYKKM